MLQGVECRCDTVEELRAVVGQQAPRPPRATTRAKARGRARASRAATAPTEEATATNGQTEELKKLPYVQRGITWDVAKKIGKKIGRKDIRKLRSNLKARQQMGE